MITTYVLSAHARLVILSRGLNPAWIESCVAAPDREEADRVDPALRHALRRIDAAEGRILRVVYNPSKSPPVIVTAFFDRSMKGQL